MRVLVSAALAAAFVLAPPVAGLAPARSQDFSITNPVEPPSAGHRDVMRQLQAWWDVHAYYPRRASQNNEGGTAKVHLVIRPDGVIWRAELVDSSGSSSLDAAATSAFRGGFVAPFPPGEPDAALDIPLHYLIAHRPDQPVLAGYGPVPSRGPFTITNEPVKSPILETMLQRTCTGTVVKEGIRNHPMYGGRHWAQAIFFRKPDGTPWVRFNEGGVPLIAPVTEAGKLVQWTGRAEHPRRDVEFYYQYTVWTDGGDGLNGNIEAYFYTGSPHGMNTGGTVDLTCATETVPAITWSALFVNTYQAPSADPP